ncbi:MAG: GAF domain-containing sensor histidine kinase [Oscillospiraceae bacterium]|nr:GAF domain-containing sensor histidine kinase [Oscillospiraceae bacterium]
MAITANRKRPLFWERFQFKIAFTYLLVIIAMLLIMNTYPVWVSRDAIYQSKYTGMHEHAHTIASAFATLETLSVEQVGDMISMLNEQGQLIITDDKGRVLYNTARGVDAAEELETALKPYNVFTSSYRRDAFRSKAAVPIISGGNVIGALLLYEYDSEQAELLQQFQLDMGNLSMAIAAIVGVFSFAASSALTKRVSVLLRAIKLAREGSFNHLVPVRGRDELAELADAFNSLTRRIQETDNLRRQFVSDASHELKTPLASMRLLADSVILTSDMPLPDVREFVGDIGDEIDRLTRMTEKLMLLTKLDAKITPAIKRISLAPLIRRAQHMLKPLADARNVTLGCSLEESCRILAEEDDIYQALFNLMENAIKYNKPGGEVNVYMFTDGERIVVHVDDNGIGIPEEDIPRLYERFYRVDKTRAREAGGAGLGLSIVSDMTARYGGTITVHSAQDKGTRFTMKFPAVPGA